MHARLLQQGCRLAKSIGKVIRQPSRTGIVSAEYAAQRDRGASTRADGRRGGGGSGGRWERGSDSRGSGSGRSSSIWGDDWDVGSGGDAAGSAGGGWLNDAAGEERGSYGRRSGGGGGGSGGREDRPRRQGGRENRWGGRESGGGGSREDRWGSRENSGSGGREDRWGSRENSGSGGREDRWGSRDSSGSGRVSRGREDRYGGRDGGERRTTRGDERYGGGRGGGGRDWQPRQGQEQGQGRRGYNDRSRDGAGGASWQRGGGEWESGRGNSPEYDNYGEDGGEGTGDSPAGGGGGLRQFWVGDVLYGVSPVLAALQAGRREVHTLYLQEGMDLSKRKDKGAIQAVKRKAEQLGAAVQYASKHDLNMMADNRPHQGVMLDCSPLEFLPMAALPDPSITAADASAATSSGRLPVWLCLDEVMDPQNFGAALRCAHFLGVAGVLTCHRNSAPLSAVVSKASAGAMELLPVHSSKSLPQTLADAKARGWQVLGAAAEQGAVGAASFVLDRPAILVMGNEGYGLRTTVRRLCDAMLQIDAGNGAEQQGLVDSLNVSVATGILLHRLLTAQQPSGEVAAPASAGASEEAAVAAAPEGASS